MRFETVCDEFCTFHRKEEHKNRMNSRSWAYANWEYALDCAALKFSNCTASYAQYTLHVHCARTQTRFDTTTREKNESLKNHGRFIVLHIMSVVCFFCVTAPIERNTQCGQFRIHSDNCFTFSSFRLVSRSPTLRSPHAALCPSAFTAECAARVPDSSSVSKARLSASNWSVLFGSS